MATWHQNRARQRGAYVLYDKIRWSVISDPPGEMCGIMLFSTKERAEEYLAGLKADYPDRARHAYILPPGGFTP